MLVVAIGVNLLFCEVSKMQKMTEQIEFKEKDRIFFSSTPIPYSPSWAISFS